jgi:hypothetical protein
MLWPNGTRTKPPVSRGGKYGDARGGNRRHAGTDFVGYADLRAILGGTVTLAGPFNNDAGHAVVIDTKLPDGRTVTVCRFHVEPGTIAVRKGQQLAEGAYLGKMGDSGNATGNCDHVEIRFWSNGSFTTVDPEVWIAAQMGGAPAFPLPPGYYFGPREPLSNKRSVSGYFSHRADLKRWQQRMKERGWPITPDGLYGDETGDVAEAFQREKGLTPDRLIGPATWAAAWTAPIT